MSEWRPIETAPKDVRILGYHPAGSFGNGYDYPAAIGIASWWKGDKLNTPRWCLDPGVVYPTHWMPLPAPPDEPTEAEMSALARETGAVE